MQEWELNNQSKYIVRLGCFYHLNLTGLASNSSFKWSNRQVLSSQRVKNKFNRDVSIIKTQLDSLDGLPVLV